jgi:hypothetical protein
MLAASIKRVSSARRLPWRGAMSTKLLALLPIYLLGCAASANDNATSNAAAVEVAPDLAKQYIQYNGTFAYEEIILERDQTYRVILSKDSYTGTWAFDLASSTLTLTPDATSTAPPQTSYPVEKDDCKPSGWFPVLMNDGHKMIPYGIDPDFEAQYCQLWTPPATQQ